MKIILTHEQADFDALASLLGAYLIDDSATPILPRKMNRNVRAFLTLYGADLPFVEARDLSSNVVIEEVTLVDTQSMVSVRGMNPSMSVHVIDHHPIKEDLPPDWNITVSGTGANTTLFVETLHERDTIIGAVQSTLLLLGIYEDTGSLTYTRTTARDLRAASYLLEQGASLQIATDFLNHPLTSDQQIIYDQLRASAEYHRIHGHTIIVAEGDAKAMEEELSTVVHKLRDLLDPDALMVLITTRSGIQLISRSTSDGIDVGQIAAHFGGGGHERAAAGIIKNRTLEEVHKELVEVLPKLVQPAINVAQIMSGNPQLLPPDTPVEEAVRMMQRFGHEGYPIVKDGKVVGLLTRRAVDRAIAHELSYTVEQLMDAGEYTVQPDDSIEHLQRLMTESGWGQVPVVQPETGEIIGIVTRTDLLKTLTPRPRIPSRQNIAERLERALPAARAELLKAVAQAAHNQHIAVYIVGGFVRDIILDRPSLDFDLVVEGDAIALARELAHRYGGRVTSHSRFGTAKWLLRRDSEKEEQHFQPVNISLLLEHGEEKDLPVSLDLVTARTEFYTHPTALPTVERSSIKLDLHRRDFTINTLALRLDGNHYGELHDYWGGLADIRQGLVRVLHSLSFVDDPTRILRAVRFEQRFGFKIENRTLDLMREALPLLDRVSGDRIRHDLNNILLEAGASPALLRLSELGILAAIHPELSWDDWLQEHTATIMASLPTPVPGSAMKNELDRPVDWEGFAAINDPQAGISLIYILWLIRLSPGLARSVSERLKLSADLKGMIQSANLLWRELPNCNEEKPSQLTARFSTVEPLALYAVYLASDHADIKRIIGLYVSKWRLITPSITGHDLRAHGVPPGPIYRQILETMRDAWLDGEIVSIEGENKLLDELVSKLIDR